MSDSDIGSGTFRPFTPDSEDGPLPGKPMMELEKLVGTAVDNLIGVTDLQEPKKTDSDVANLTLHQCAREGVATDLLQLIGHMGSNVKKKINLHDEDELSPLHYAARHNNLEAVKILIEHGADVNDTGEDGDTPLHFAARYRRERSKKKTEDQKDGELIDQTDAANLGNLLETTVVGYLIKKGAKGNAQDKYGQSALHFAAMRGNEDAASVLLSLRDREDISVEASDLQLLTPLHVACIHNQKELARMLLECSANLRATTREQSTPLHLACAEGHLELVQLLFEFAERQTGWVAVSDMVTDRDSTDYTCLHHAIDNGNFEIAKMCIDRKADVNTPCSHYQFPLHLAAATGEKQTVALLLDNHARIDALNDNQATPLHKAASFNHFGVVELLVKRGAKINRRDMDDFTALLLAACYGHKETLELLIRLGADYKVTDKEDKTCIYLAAEENKLEALETLLSYPAIQQLINVGDRYDTEPLHISAQNGYVEICKLLLEKGADIDSKNEEEQTPLHLAAKHGRTNIVRQILLDDKRAVNDEDENSNTPLHLAALFGNAKAGQVLINYGADVAARNYNLWTPLDCAASKGWTKTGKVLLENDAPVEAMDKAKTTPLHLASRFGHDDMVKLLIEWDASVSQRDSDGLNCLDLAIEHNNESTALTIINSDEWESALRNERIDTETLRRDTPMRKLIRKMPDVAEAVFNKCMKLGAVKNIESKDFEVMFTYEFLDDAYCDWRDKEGTTDVGSTTGSFYDDENKLISSATAYTSDGGTLKKNHPLNIMVTSSREDLLAHPLVSSLLQYKWNQFGRFFYYINLTIYAVFLIFLTGYILTTPPPYNMTENDNSLSCEDFQNKGRKQDSWGLIGKWVIIALSAWNVLRELLQIYQAKLGYFGFENLIEWVVYVTSVLVVIDFSDCQRETGYRESWQWQMAAVAIFLAWINLVLFIQKFPQLGIYVVMFTSVLVTFFKFFTVFLLFIIAFALGYHVLLGNHVSMSTVPYALVKTSVMMIGEFEYTDIFHNTGEIVHYRALTYVLFVIFMIIMSILIMNLLVGLAVDDIKAVQEQAELKRMAMQVDLALDVERLVPDFIRKRVVVRRRKLLPNKDFNLINRILAVGRDTVTAQSIVKALNPDLDEMERIEEAQDKMQVKIKKLRNNIKDLQAQNSKIESMLHAIIKSQHIRWTEEDFQDDEEEY